MRKITRLLILLFFVSSVPAAGLRAQEVLTWDACIKEAAKNHPDLIAAQEQVKESEASKKITASTLYPQVDASVTASTARNDTGITSSTFFVMSRCLAITHRQQAASELQDQ
jgi:outer membrane protein TolC